MIIQKSDMSAQRVESMNLYTRYLQEKREREAANEKRAMFGFLFFFICIYIISAIAIEILK